MPITPLPLLGPGTSVAGFSDSPGGIGAEQPAPAQDHTGLLVALLLQMLLRNPAMNTFPFGAGSGALPTGGIPGGGPTQGMPPGGLP
jgi:hypothetical protein